MPEKGNKKYQLSGCGESNATYSPAATYWLVRRLEYEIDHPRVLGYDTKLVRRREGKVLGRHATDARWGSSRMRAALKGCLVGTTLVVLVSAVAGYAFIRSIENKIHKPGRNRPKVTPAIVGRPQNILLLGIDRREDEADTGRSDSIIILRLEPGAKDVIMWSIPRDLRVTIPGREGHDKINASYAYGGTALTIRTVEDLTGVNINHYVAIDHRGFVKMVDILGGVRVYLREKMGEKGTEFYLGKGWHNFKGSSALDFVRFRHDARGDFGRMQRQQRFLGALFDKALSFGAFYKLPFFINAFADTAETDLSVRQLLDLVSLIKGIDRRNVEAITTPGVSTNRGGVSYVEADEETIAEIAQYIGAGGRTSAKGWPIPNSLIRIEVLNATTHVGVARRVADLLDVHRFEISSVGDTKRRAKRTVIFYGLGAYKKARKAQKLLKHARIVYSKEVSNNADLDILVGSDWQQAVKDLRQGQFTKNADQSNDGGTGSGD